MKKIFVLIGFLMLAAISYGQTILPKGVYIGRGTTPVSGTNIGKIDSATIVTNGASKELRFYNGADTLYNPPPVANQIDLIEALDTVPLSSLGVLMVKDSTGTLEGNYMTRQNYFNDPVNSGGFKVMKDFGSTIIAVPVFAPGVNIASLTMLDGRAYWTLFYLPEAQTVTGIKFEQITQGNYTADNYNGVALYSVVGTTIHKIDSTANDGDFWKSAAGVVTKALPGGPHALSAGYYLVAAVYNQSAVVTAPVIYGMNNTSVLSGYLFPDNKKMSGFNALTELPHTEVFGDINTAYQVGYFILY